VEVRGLQRTSSRTAIIGDSGVYDWSGKLIASGKQGTLKSGPKSVEGKVEYQKIDAKNFVKIDDEVTWLPITIQFQKITRGREFPK
jgi:hypothetical protein